MARYKSHTIGNITEYVEFICKKCKPDNVLFRGQPTDEPLVPKIARLNLKKEVLYAEQEMLREFKRRAVPFLDIQPKSSWDWLAIAQHHGMATRLLDWTLNPLAALWFAVNQPPVKGGRKSLPGVVWALVPGRSDYAVVSTKHSPFKVERTKVFRPKHMTTRLVSQAGWFTVHKYMRTKKRFLPLEKNKTYAPKLTKLRIPPESFFDMRFELDRFNVNTATLFPDADGLCSHIQWMHSLLDDER